MKFILFCDVLRAPGDKTKPFVGARLSGAAVRQSTGESTTEFETKLNKLFNSVRGRDLPKPSRADFDAYLDDLVTDAGPLFPWLGGELEFSYLWASAKPKQVPNPGDIDSGGFTIVPMPLPTDANPINKANFQLTDTALRWLLYTAIKNLISSNPEHTDLFQNVEPFKLAGWDDAIGRTAIQEIDDDATRGFRYEAFMAGLASLPAPIPHGRLNLVRFVQVTAIKPTSAGDTTLLVAAPRFKPRGAAGWLEPEFGDSASPAVKWSPVSPNIIATIPYKSDFGGHEIEVLCRALDLGEDLTSSFSFLQRDSLWVLRRHEKTSTDSREGVGFDDWLAPLPEMIADTFDLPRLLLQAVEDDAKAPGAPLTKALAGGDRLNGAEKLSEAILMALRDTVGPGCIGTANGVLKGPNGSPVHEAIIDRVNKAIEEFRPGAKLDVAECKILTDEVVRYDKVFRDGFRGGTGDAQRLEWIEIVGKVVGPGLELPTVAPAFRAALAQRVANSTDTKGAFDQGPLRRVVDAATSPANAAALQIALWRKAGTPSAKLDGWLTAAEEAFAMLFDRGFRLVEILRKVNIDLPWGEEQGIWKKAADPSVRDIEVLKGSDTAPGHIRESIAAYLFGTACESDGAPGALERVYQSEHGRMGRLPAAARADVAKGVDAAAKARLENWFKEPKPEGGDMLLSGELAADAHPVALQVDRLVVGAGDTPDFNENLAGYGLLMRRSQPADPWRCLTATFAEADPDNIYNNAHTEITFETAARSVMGALPVSYTSQMPQALVMYDNRPVIGDSVADVEILPQEEDPDPRIVRLIQPTVQDIPPAETLLPFLAYGATYEVAPFGISNHGALPEMVRRNDHPAILNPAKLTDTLFPANSPFVRRFSYLRRTGIGSLRVDPFFMPPQHAGRLFHPMVTPKDTKLVAEEILLPSQAVEPWESAGAARPLKMKTALLLSAANGGPLVAQPENIDCGELKLRISAPVTPLEDFDRWIAFDEALSGADKDEFRAFRKGVRSFQFEKTATLLDSELALRKALARNDTAAAEALTKEIASIKGTLDLQDPAVGALAVSVTRVRRDGKLAPDAVTAHAPELFEWTWKWQPGMDPEQPFANSRLPVELICRLSSDRAKPLFDRTTMTVWIAPGDVLVVRLFAGVDDALFVEKVNPDGKRRFDKTVRDSSIGKGNDAAVVLGLGNVKYRLFATHAFALEGASLGLPSDIALAPTINGRIVGDLPDAFDERPGDIRLDFKRAASIAMDAVGSITVGSQAWRWTGRPLSPFPFAKIANLNDLPAQDPQDPKMSEPPSPSDHALLWDVEGFAERLDETLDDELIAAPISEKIDTAATPPASTPQAMRIALRSPSRADSARYMRFRVVASSRYSAAYAAARQALVAQPANWNSTSGKWKTPWYRILRPARKPASVPKPGIRALIPLTRALRDGDTLSPVAGVLAVADGAWFEHAGLADWMLAGVEIAHRKKLVIGNNVTAIAAAAEIGPDPLVRTYGLGQELGTTPDQTKLRTAVPLAVAGPLGHSFDTGTATGLFLNSSFIVRAPEFAATDPTAWWMGKLAFRRYVMAEGTRDYWNENVTAPVKGKQPQVAVTLHSISASALPASIKLRAIGSLLSGGAVKADAAILIAASRSDSAWTVEVEDRETKAKDNFTIAAATFDLRVIAVRRVSRVPEGPEQYVWYEILVLVKPKNQVWQIAWQTQWFNASTFAENKDPPEMELEIDFPIDSHTGVIVGDTRISTVLQVSEATEGRWAQFMPNAEALGRSSKVPLTALTLSVDPKSDKQLLLSSNGSEFAWLATDALKTKRGKENQGLYNLLLVTKRVASVSGTDEEAYVGLYHSSAGYDQVAQAVVLSWFGDSSQTPSLGDSSGLMGRVLTVRSGNPMVTAADIASWQKDPWKCFFPSEAVSEPENPDQVFGDQRPRDASAQIIEIYAPIVATNG